MLPHLQIHNPRSKNLYLYIYFLRMNDETRKFNASFAIVEKTRLHYFRLITGLDGTSLGQQAHGGG